MKFSLDGHLTVDLQYLWGSEWNVTAKELDDYKAVIANAAECVRKIRQTGKGPGDTSVLFTRLPYILEDEILIDTEEKRRLELVDRKGRKQDIIISIGVGGSFLGNQALFDMFCGPYWNMRLDEERKGRPKVFFAGQNADPQDIMCLVRQLRREQSHKGRNLRVLLLVISKSGTTIEPMAAYRVLKRELEGFCDLSYIAVTDKHKGALHDLAEQEGWERFSVPDGIGGRFSVFSPVGLVFAGLLGYDVKEFLRGARFVEESCQGSVFRNPALMLATLKFIAMKEHGIVAEVIMPYGMNLRSLGWWYAQLLGESLGKKFDTHGNIVYNGRIPVACVGTTDMHSLTQEHQQGKNNKLLQFISVENSEDTVAIPCTEGNITGMVDMEKILLASARANEEALAQEERMSCHIAMKSLDLFHVGALMYFFLLTIAYEGALADINTYDQPGVEDYKTILHSYLRSYLEE